MRKVELARAKSRFPGRRIGWYHSKLCFMDTKPPTPISAESIAVKPEEAKSDWRERYATPNARTAASGRRW